MSKIETKADFIKELNKIAGKTDNFVFKSKDPFKNLQNFRVRNTLDALCEKIRFEGSLYDLQEAFQNLPE